MGFSSITGDEYGTVMNADNASFDGTLRGGVLQADGELWIGSSSSPHVVKNNLTAGTGITITNGPGTITISDNGLNDLHTSQFIVNSSGTSGTGANYTTIGAAITAAQATGLKQTIFIMPGDTGTYTENITLTDGINLSAFPSDSFSPSVTIIGKVTMSTAGSCSISGIRIQTNASNAILLSGTGASSLILVNCVIACNNSTGISFTNSNAASSLQLLYCEADIQNTGNAIFSSSAAGNIKFYFSNLFNTILSTTASTISSGTLTISHCLFDSPITGSGTSTILIDKTTFNCGPINTTALTIGGSGTNLLKQSAVLSGTASSISIGSTLNASEISISSSNANAITGAGTISYGLIDFTGSSSTINTSTQTSLASRGGSLTLNTPMVVGSGGTGNSTLTSNGILTGNGTSAIQSSSTALITSGIYTNTTQPLFSAVLSSSTTDDKTGDATAYTVIFDTEIFDQGNYYDNTTGVFTAPVTGKYLFSWNISYRNIVAQNNAQMRITTSNRTYIGPVINPVPILVGSAIQMNMAVIADMDASDTCTFTALVAGGTKTVGIAGTASSAPVTYAAGYLIS